jgi:hypothetical protein
MSTGVILNSTNDWNVYKYFAERIFTNSDGLNFLIFVLKITLKSLAILFPSEYP